MSSRSWGCWSLVQSDFPRLPPKQGSGCDGFGNLANRRGRTSCSLLGLICRTRWTRYVGYETCIRGAWPRVFSLTTRRQRPGDRPRNQTRQRLGSIRTRPEECLPSASSASSLGTCPPDCACSVMPPRCAEPHLPRTVARLGRVADRRRLRCAGPHRMESGRVAAR